MGEFSKPIPGEADALSRDSRYHGKLIETMGLVQSQGLAAKDGQRLTPAGFPRYTIKNETADDVPRGGVLGLDGFIFDADDNEQNFLATEPKFRGVAPLESHGTRIAIAVAPIPAGEIRSECVALFGPVAAKVDITDEEHRFCKVIDDDVTKLVSDASGPFPMLPAQSGVGTKWALVTLGGGGASGGSLPILAVAIVAEAGAAAGDNFKVENPWLYEPSGEEGEEEGTWLPGEWTPNPDWVITCGSVDHLKILEEPEVEGGEPTTPVLIVVSDLFLDFPIIGNKVRIESVIDYATDFICTRKTC